ncbi:MULTISPECIES: hypothetical protein [Sphingobacterium]|uniref:Uncharacterized protein n=1 Tax=Sphingobacterium athyrii TaxID=2152717 RepID=A0A363NLN6_9SPHI|nr:MULTISPECIES: hypothetical protein [Sphingobacterium]PUV21610.1 hypothetical protein DCO56_25005 [Sphingobacterium athyrii]QIH35840.1 hypothetical protein G6053_24490 [Sphingobacterium sp. DR205]
MEQMKIASEKIVPIDFDAEELPVEIRELRPVVFREETSYWCLLGPDPHRGIFGNGESVADALEDWLVNLRKRLKQSDENDEVLNYIRDSLNASNRDVW